MCRVLLCSSLLSLTALPLSGQAATGHARDPLAVRASFDQTWQAVEKVSRDDIINDRLMVVQESPGYRRARFAIHIPVSDFRAASWASCVSGTEPPVGPRSGMVEVVVTGDTAAATVAVSVEWNGQAPGEMQRPMQCRDLGEYSKDIEKNVRKQAERAAARR